MARLEAGLRWNDNDGCWELRAPETGGNTFFEGEEEPCINGGALAVGAYFGRPTESLARRLLGEQLNDGGWNCEAPKSTRSSFHTTICVLEGLLEYERAVGSGSEITTEIAASRRRGEEYLLQAWPLPPALHRRGRRSSIPEVCFPAPLSLRHSPCARLFQGRRRRTRSAQSAMP